MARRFCELTAKSEQNIIMYVSLKSGSIVDKYLSGFAGMLRKQQSTHWPRCFKRYQDPFCKKKVISLSCLTHLPGFCGRSCTVLRCSRHKNVTSHSRCSELVYVWDHLELAHSSSNDKWGSVFTEPLDTLSWITGTSEGILSWTSS